MAKPKERTYELKHPVEFAGQEVTEITIKRKLAFLRGQRITAGVDAGGDVKVELDIGAQLDLAARMIGQVPAFLDALDEEDLAEVMGDAQDFLFSTLGNGNKQ